MNTTRNERGFTLLELLMVVIIIAILASIALPQYFRVVERSRSAQSLQLLASIRGSQIRFRAQSPTNIYATTAQLPTLDIAPLPAPPTGWAAPVVGATGPGGNVRMQRTSGAAAVLNAFMDVDMDTGAVCASTAAAGTEWGVSGAAC